MPFYNLHMIFVSYLNLAYFWGIKKESRNRISIKALPIQNTVSPNDFLTQGCAKVNVLPQRESDTRFSASSFFHESGFPQAPKILGDIRGWMFVTGVNGTTDKFFVGANDTGEKTVEPLLFYLHLGIILGKKSFFNPMVPVAFKQNMKKHPGFNFFIIIFHRCRWHRWLIFTHKYLCKFS